MRAALKVPKNKGQDHPRAKFTNEEIVTIRFLRKEGERVVDIANEFGVHKSTISKICRGERYPGV